MPESTAQSSNVPESDATPDKVVVISSGSDGSDEERTPNSYVTEIFVKKEIISDENAVSDVIVTVKSEVLEDQNVAPGNCAEPFLADVECSQNLYVTEVVAPKEVISDELPVSDVTVIDISDLIEEQGILSQRPNVDCTRSSQAMESDTKRMGNSYESPLKVSAVSDVPETDSSDLLQEQGIATNNCIELQRSDVDCSLNSNVTEINTKTTGNSDDPSLKNTVVDDVNVSEEQEMLKEQGFMTSNCTEPQGLNVECTNNSLVTEIQTMKALNSDDPTLDEVAVCDVNDLLEEPEIATNNCVGLQRTDVTEIDANEVVISDEHRLEKAVVADIPVNDHPLLDEQEFDSEAHQLSISPLKASIFLNTSPLEMNLNPSCSYNINSTDPVNDDISQSKQNDFCSAEQSKDNSQAVENDFCDTGPTEIVIDNVDESNRDICYGISQNIEHDSTDNQSPEGIGLNSSENDLLDKLDQRADKPYVEGQSMSDDEVVKSGRYGVKVKNESVDLRGVFSSSAIGILNSMDDRMLRAKNVLAPVIKNDVDGNTSEPSVSPKSHDDALSVEESLSGNSEYEREYGQRPPERDDKLLARIKRRRSAAKLICLADIPAKRKRIEASTATESDSDTETVQRFKRTHRQPKKSSHKRRFFRMLSKNLRERRKKMKAKVQKTTDGNFVVTTHREDKVVERMKGFVMVPDGH